MTEDDELLARLPLPQRLALAYSPASVRPFWLVLLAFDSRLGAAIQQAREPILARIRLAWWRDQLRNASGLRERSDPLVVGLERIAGMDGALLDLIDGWEGILAEQFDAQAIGTFAEARGCAFVALAAMVGAPDPAVSVERAARRWAIADLACGLGKAEERRLARAVSIGIGNDRTVLSRRMRPLAVLDGLARRSIARGGKPLLDGPASGLTAIRLGLFGR